MAALVLIGEAIFFAWLFSRKYSLFPRERKLIFDQPKSVSIEENGLAMRIESGKKTVGEVLTEKQIEIKPVDRLYPSRETLVFPGSRIIIERPASLEIKVDGRGIKNESFAQTVLDAILENDIHLSHLDEVKPPRSASLRDGIKIEITRIKHEEVTEKEEIEYKTLTTKDPKVDWGEKKIMEKGEEGERETVYKISYENGEQVSKVKLSSKIVKEPVTEKISFGTRINIGKSDSGIASWYGTDPLSCSSRDFPAGTWLRVTSRDSGRQAFVRVEGYGPQPQTGKLIDLSRESFSKLAPPGQGTVRVKVEEVLNRGFVYTGKE